MKDIKDIYNINYVKDNIIYSLDMLRLKTYTNFIEWSNIVFFFETYHKDKIKKSWIGTKIQEFHYNYVIEIEEGKSYYLAFHHNNEKEYENKDLYNLTIEFNPNKLKDSKLLMYILNKFNRWYIKSYDIAFDLRIGIEDLIYDMSGRRIEKIENHGYKDKTIMLGKGDGRVKIYNKKKESDLNILGELTRIEISRQIEEFAVSDIKIFHYDDILPIVYTADYIYSLSDYKDKTTLALLYAVQNGFPIRDLSKTYRKKIKTMLEGGNKIKFYKKYIEDVIKQTIYFYFIRVGESKQIIF